MIALTNIFNDIRTTLLANVDGINTVELWNTQIENDEKEQAYAADAVYIEFDEIIFPPEGRELNPAMVTSEGNYLRGQKGITIVKLHCVFKKYKTINEAYAEIMPVLSDINYCIYLIQPGATSYYSSINRVSASQDSLHDQLSDWQMDYEIGFQEPNYGRGLTDVNIPVGTISIEIGRRFIEETSCSILLESLTTAQLNECILPTYDFSVLDTFNSLTDQQKEDLAAQLFADGTIVTENPNVITP